LNSWRAREIQRGGGITQRRVKEKNSNTCEFVACARAKIIVDMPMLKRPSCSLGGFQAPKTDPASSQQLSPSNALQAVSDSPDAARSLATPMAAVKPSFLLHRQYTPPTSIKPAHPREARAPFKSPHPPPAEIALAAKENVSFVASRKTADDAIAVSQQSVIPDIVAPERVFACMYTKVSKKKHKIWSDGFVVFNNNSKKLTLKDADGKDVGKMGWQLPSFTADLKNGSVINYVCGHDLELCQEVELSQYSSGQCFLSKSKKLPSVSIASASCLSKAQKTPFSSLFDRPSVRKAAASLYSPDDPNAVVLVNGNAARGTVAIVLEPRLASLLRPHQIDGVTFCVTCLLGGEPELVSESSCSRRFGPGHLPEGRCSAAFEGGAILADDMGLGSFPFLEGNCNICKPKCHTGKTAQSLAVAYTLIRQGPFGEPCAAKALIVCPTTLTVNWNREIIKWIGMERVRALVISAGDQALSQIQEFVTSPIRKMCIISYELLSKYSDAFSKCSSIGLLICDEAHRLKSKTLSITKKAILSVPTRRRLLLSGTPIQNNLDELYSLCSIAQPLALDDYDVFKNVFSNPIVASRDPAASSQIKQLGAARASELAGITQRFLLRRAAEDIMASLLPPRTDYVIFVNMAKEQAVAYKSVVDLLRAESASAATPSAAALSLLQIMRRVCNHPALHSDSGSLDPKLSAAALLSPAAICALSPKFALLNGILGEAAFR
jgi:DNA repair and recombination protein RAD54B